MLRVAALILDTLLLGVISFIVNSVYGVMQPTSGLSIGGGAFSTTAPWLLLTVVAFLYFAVPEAMFGATPGKAWARLRVVRLDGRPLGVGAVIVRNLLKPVDSLPVLYIVGGILVMVTRGSQRLGDLVAGTTVVYRHRALDPGATRSSTAKARRRLVASLVLLTVFTAAFDYFGRPPLAIAGLYDTQTAPMNGVTSYSLGQPQWGFGQVTYPITVQTTQGVTEPAGANAVMNCRRSITLDWGWPGGWSEGSGGWSCGY